MSRKHRDPYNQAGKAAKDRYVAISNAIIDSDAFSYLSGHATKVYLLIRRRYFGSNNGRIGAGRNETAETLHLSKEKVADAFVELEHVGLIQMTRPGSWRDHRRTEWALTDRQLDVTLPLGIEHRVGAWRSWRPDAPWAKIRTKARRRPLKDGSVLRRHVKTHSGATSGPYSGATSGPRVSLSGATSGPLEADSGVPSGATSGPHVDTRGDAGKDVAPTGAPASGREGRRRGGTPANVAGPSSDHQQQSSGAAAASSSRRRERPSEVTAVDVTVARLIDSKNLLPGTDQAGARRPAAGMRKACHAPAGPRNRRTIV